MVYMLVSYSADEKAAQTANNAAIDATYITAISCSFKTAFCATIDTANVAPESATIWAAFRSTKYSAV
jgi:hypothetical protein